MILPKPTFLFKFFLLNTFSFSFCSSCREQRVTLILISIMIGLSVFMTPILSFIPMPVLYGVFLYMGTSPLADMQFYDRLLILFMPAKYQPDHSYLRKVTQNLSVWRGLRLCQWIVSGLGFRLLCREFTCSLSSSCCASSSSGWSKQWMPYQSLSLSW